MASKSSIVNKTRIGVSIVILVLISLVFAFRLGSYLNGAYYIFYQSYVGDLLIPFAAYFMLCMNDSQFQFLKKWFVKSILVFGAMTFSELMQYYEIYFFGVTFDPVDILMYAIGALTAAFVDRGVFSKLLMNWNTI